jgi:hypothetical protein
MARQLIAAARAAGETSVPSVTELARAIYRWECGMGPAPARYQLYYRQVLAIPGAPFGTLDTLRWCWGDVYDISHDGGTWQAARKDGTGRAIAAATPDGLNAAIREDWLLLRAGGAR